MNTRIQVEHPVTELVCGIDLVRAMIQVAQGDPLPFQQSAIRRSGHAIEVRINAEDPVRYFLPSPGTTERAQWPQGPGVRVDTMTFDGCRVPPFYDSLV